ncbi:MAG: hypothetical protein HY221_02580 [Candidatus Sungbacteria bacterium]|uniref:Uncharacterized protein n=1 Tax=Candidatus Sungiibacteriota bacterium TaxID=2750080 RepID=A0A932VS00_9BACT|nr:hypothetical protein [Candidatus Sungbacteria bacterium]
MDLLDAYKKTAKEAPAPQHQMPEWQDEENAPKPGTFIRILMKLSGGRIHDPSQTTGILIAVVAIIFGIALFVFLGAR